MSQPIRPESFAGKPPPISGQDAEDLARAGGFEPTTNRLTANYSTAELHPNTSPDLAAGRAV